MNVLRIDFDAELVTLEAGKSESQFAFASAEAFAAVSEAWLRLGWDTKYVYSFTWMGRPIIQLPEDMVRMQEVVYEIRPDVIVETGIAHGGSLVFYASLLKAMGHGRVIGIDIDIRQQNRKAIEDHELSSLIDLVEGSSIDTDVIDEVKHLVGSGQRVLVSLDGNHSKAHVLAELEAYAPLVSLGSYIVAADGIMGDLIGAPRSTPSWEWDNPREAAAEFLKSHDQFVLEPPAPVFNEGLATGAITYWPGGWLRRVR